MSDRNHGDVTQLLDRLNGGDRGALDDLVPLVYDELRRLAAWFLKKERHADTLQATALVHEAYVRLVGQHSVTWQNRGHFFAIAAQSMRRILVDRARAQSTAKRGGQPVPVTLDEAVLVGDGPQVDLVALDRALDELARADPREARIVELRYFAGLTVDEVAVALGISEATVKREWRHARAWLLRALKG